MLNVSVRSSLQPSLIMCPSLPLLKRFITWTERASGFLRSECLTFSHVTAFVYVLPQLHCCGNIVLAAISRKTKSQMGRQIDMQTVLFLSSQSQCDNKNHCSLVEVRSNDAVPNAAGVRLLIICSASSKEACSQLHGQ